MAEIQIQEVALRLALAFVSGFIIGLERENHGRAAGLRTTVLVSVASAIAMILSAYLFSDTASPSGTWRPDPARLAAGILTGMGFLGAGVIMREGKIVRGVTTAAALWFTTVLGLAYGAGHIGLGLAGLATAMVILFVLPEFERFIDNDWYGSITITMNMDAMADVDLKKRIEQQGITIKSVELERDLPAQRRVFLCRIKYKNADVFRLSEQVVRELAECPGVIDVKWA